jgi:hypothetical protein
MSENADSTLALMVMLSCSDLSSSISSATFGNTVSSSGSSSLSSSFLFSSAGLSCSTLCCLEAVLELLVSVHRCLSFAWVISRVLEDRFRDGGLENTSRYACR